MAGDFTGHYAPASVGDYLAGPSHVLPTYGSARFAGALRVDDFVKHIHIVSIDEQGFIAIKGRARRFAKIGGEMISLAAVEALASELWPNALSAVVSVPDMRKGERLITDSRGIVTANTTPVHNGAIFRIVRARPTSAEDSDFNSL